MASWKTKYSKQVVKATERDLKNRPAWAKGQSASKIAWVERESQRLNKGAERPARKSSEKGKGFFKSLWDY